MGFMQTVEEAAWGRHHRSVVRIGVATATADGKDCSYCVGTGVVIDDLLVLTCAHILNARVEGQVELRWAQLENNILTGAN
jgi:hypothetical protein